MRLRFWRLGLAASVDRPLPARPIPPRPAGWFAGAAGLRRPPFSAATACGAGAAGGELGFGLRLRPPLHAIAERAQDRRKILARRADQRGHAVDDGEAAARKRARRLSARQRLRAKPAPGGSDRQAVREYRRARRARRTPDSRRCDRAPASISRLTGIEVRPLPARCNKSSRPLLCGPSWRSAQKLRGERARRRLEQRRQIDVIGAEAHAVFAQSSRAPAVPAPSLRRRRVADRARRAPRPAGRRRRARCRSRRRRPQVRTTGRAAFRYAI